MTATFDRRLTPARDDLAARHLDGVLGAARFVDGEPALVVAATAGLKPRPDHTASLDTELLFGEPFTVYDRHEGWAWGQAGLDGYVGYLPEHALGDAGPAATHRVAALRTFVYPTASIKAPILSALSMASRVAIASVSGRFAELAGGGFVVAQHVVPLAHADADWVATAERLLGIPYLWGGRSTLGLDCSALVQLSLASSGIAAPRDTDMQAGALGERIADHLPSDGLQRGDLVFWKGHVAVMVDGARIVHANATHMAVSIDDVRAFAARVEAETGPVTEVRRLGRPLS